MPLAEMPPTSVETSEIWRMPSKPPNHTTPQHYQGTQQTERHDRRRFRIVRSQLLEKICCDFVLHAQFGATVAAMSNRANCGTSRFPSRASEEDCRKISLPRWRAGDSAAADAGRGSSRRPAIRAFLLRHRIGGTAQRGGYTPSHLSENKTNNFEVGGRG